MPNDADYQALEAENLLLRERIYQLEDALFAETPLPPDWGLTVSEERVVACLLSRPQATKDAIMAALYRNDGKDEPELKIVDVFVCKARKKLAPFGIEIKTVWGRGYMIDASVRVKIRHGAVVIVADEKDEAA
ncbi:helix-turn-helix domain-containing protein [Labrenzia sp. DG1229]|uniref:helix-turn-helix domain-containing protein n=1 Tax=Labrenzia sp. DG1229 TaxID=681847 RepID=UPI0005680D1E|nr:helix-turn-helix domain-containing protein [Labrenzia sp. DG1229]